jgi:hypothetical protein
VCSDPFGRAHPERASFGWGDIGNVLPVYFCSRVGREGDRVADKTVQDALTFDVFNLNATVGEGSKDRTVCIHKLLNGNFVSERLADFLLSLRLDYDSLVDLRFSFEFKGQFSFPYSVPSGVA